MVKRYFGGVISSVQPVLTSSSASGMFNAVDAGQSKTAGKWPSPGTLVSSLYADAAYNSQGWVSASTDYTGATGAFSYSLAGIQERSGGARTIPLPYLTTTKGYFEVYLTSITSSNLLLGMAGDANVGGYSNVPCIYVANGNGYGGYTGVSLGVFNNGDSLCVAYNASTGK